MALDELDPKQALLSRDHGPGRHERFEVDFATGTLTFFDGRTPKVEASIVPVSTHAPVRQNLQFTWANRQHPERVWELAARTRELQAVTGFTRKTGQVLFFEIEPDPSLCGGCTPFAASGRIRDGQLHR